MRVIAFANHKGGVGKTTSAHNIGAVLADCGRRVLLIDVDPQGSLSAAAGVKEPALSMADVMGNAEPGQTALAAVVVEIGPNLSIAPSDLSLAASEATMRAQYGAEMVLRDALNSVEGFDVALVDCPPSLSIMTVNALAAASAVIVPTQPSGQDLRGLTLFRSTLAKVQQRLNPRLVELGVLVCMHDDRLIHHRNAIDAMARAGLRVLYKVPRSVRAQEAATQCVPIVHYDADNPVSQAYRTIGEGLNRWLENQAKTN